MLSFICAAVLPIALALLFLRRPLWRQAPALESETRALLADVDQLLAAGRLSPEEHASARAELESWLLDEASKSAAPGTASLQLPQALKPALLAATLPPLAVVLYLLLSTPEPATPDPALAAETAAPTGTQAMLEQTLAELAARVEKEPGNGRAWTALARAYRVLGRLPEAAKAYERVGAALARSPALLVEYADVLAAQAGGQFAGRPLQLVKQALALDPQHVAARSLYAKASIQRQDTALALSS